MHACIQHKGRNAHIRLYMQTHMHTYIYIYLFIYIYIIIYKIHDIVLYKYAVLCNIAFGALLAPMLHVQILVLLH